jgi:hypothetical protein
MILNGMEVWEEWEWEEEVQAMPVLEELRLIKCKLGRIPPGLASHATTLRKLTIWGVKRLNCVENFASVVVLDLHDNPDLTRISNFSKLQRLEIDCCWKLESLEEMNIIRRLVLTIHYRKKRLPMYLDREQQELCFCIYRRGKGSKHLQFTNTSSSRPALLCFNTTGDLTLIPVLL